MAADRSKAEQQRSDEPKVAIWDGDADGYLDAVEAYARYARKHHKNGTDEWIYGEKCPIKEGMTEPEIHAACELVIQSVMKTNTKLGATLRVRRAAALRHG